MNILKTSAYKRFDKLYEKILYTQVSRILLGILYILAVVSMVLPGKLSELSPASTVANALISSIVVFLLSDIGISIMSRYPAVHRLRYVVPVSLTVAAVMLLGILFFRVEYARSVLAVSYLAVFSYLILSSAIVQRYRRPKIGVIPCGDVGNLMSLPRVSWRVLKNCENDTTRYDAIAVDFPALTPAWEKYVSDGSLKGRAFISSRELLELLSGRVDTKHLSSVKEGGLEPSSLYGVIKRISDILLVLFSAPLVLPVTLLAALVVKLESPGGAFFSQNRVGKGGKEFRIYKLRSMCANSEKDGAQFASAGDMRVTRFGKFIRKTRIDELPQFLNILKGDMSLIGPRPEQKVFVEEFEKNIPFYGYRHVVRPGITGWAQVTHGYAASEDDTRLKLEHDLYYIKNFSFWLDVLIVFKTIHTMLTGFGAR